MLDLYKSEKGGMACLKDQRLSGETAIVVLWELCDAVEFRSIGK